MVLTSQGGNYKDKARLLLWMFLLLIHQRATLNVIIPKCTNVLRSACCIIRNSKGFGPFVVLEMFICHVERVNISSYSINYSWIVLLWIFTLVY